MKIMLCISCLSYGGAEKNIKFIAHRLLERGHEVIICNFNTKPTVQKLDDRIRIVDMPTYKKRYVKRLQQLFFIKRLIKKECVDLLISFLFMPNALSAIAGRLTRTPVIVSERADPGQLKGIADRTVYFFYRYASGAVFQTEGARNLFPKKLRRKSTVIPNPIFINESIPDVSYEEREKTVVSVGRFANTQKRYDVMLKAFAIFSKSHPEYTLKLYGDGEDEGKIREWCEELRIADRVKLMGVTSTPMADTCRDGIFLITSDYEGISNALLEAMATGLPCVSTDHTPGGARLLIEDGVNGLLAPMGDFEAIARAMQKFADNPDLAKSCGERAREVTERFAPDRIFDMWEKYLTSLIER